MFKAVLDAVEAIDLTDAASADATRERVHGKMRAAASADPDRLTDAVRSLDPLDFSEASRLAHVYEALSPNMSSLSSFYLNELDRMLQLCQAHPRSKPAFFALGAFMFVEDHADGRSRDEVRRRLVEGLRSPAAAVRRACADLIGGLGLEGDSSARTAVEGCLQDPDWRVRALAESSLEGAGVLPFNHKPAALDRLRRKLFDWTSYV